METKKKILLTALILFMAFQLFFIVKRVHNYPFMIYDMYSRPEDKHTIYNQYLIIAGSDTINLSQLPLLLEGKLLNTLKLYDYHLAHQSDPWASALQSRSERGLVGKRGMKLLSNSPENVAGYPAWLRDQLQYKVLREPVSSLTVNKLKIDPASGEVLKSTTLIDL